MNKGGATTVRYHIVKSGLQLGTANRFPVYSPAAIGTLTGARTFYLEILYLPVEQKTLISQLQRTKPFTPLRVPLFSLKYSRKGNLTQAKGGNHNEPEKVEGEDRTMKRTLYLKLLRLLQSKCQHPDYAVKADIHEGGVAATQVQWCECCGAFRFNLWVVEPLLYRSHWVLGDWREPRPDWYTPKERKEYLDALKESK